MHVDDSECDEKRALCLMVLFLVKGDVEGNLKQIYTESQVNGHMHACL